MPRKKAADNNIDMAEVKILAYPFFNCPPVRAWISMGFVMTVAGCPAASVPLEIYHPGVGEMPVRLFNVALEIIRRKGYRKAEIVLPDGGREKIGAV